jgi:4-aminobutyrate aminotransferase-like enzyme
MLAPVLYETGARGRRARSATPVWRRARGSWVTDVEGRRYLDLVSGFGAAMLGHAHPAVVRALRRQAGRLVHGFGDVHPHEERATLAAELVRIAPVPDGRVLWAQHGAEAVELAWRSAWLSTGRPGVLAFEGGYHGLTLGALAVTGWRALRAPFAPLLSRHAYFAPYPPCDRCARGDFGCVADSFDRAERAAARRGGIGAVLVEPVQGRGGQVVPPRGWLAAVAREAKRRGWLLIADEIYTGLGRTGRPFACEHERVRPDLLCLGKAIGSGMPLAAVIGRARIMAAWRRAASGGEAAHAATFLAHPLACAAARATLAVWRREKLWRRASLHGRRLARELREAALDRRGVSEIRGLGLLAGVSLVNRRGHPDARRARAVVRAALAEGLIVLAGGAEGNVVSLSPSLLITETERRLGVRRLARAMEAAGA